ncbi:MAG: type I-F CRISPR-associated protein Csy2 [Deltaproteobacteria bacterium]|jgi:CRISPR-associated protein Csy2|nr:type I-F CRISPR-associated protein Csy2 [Deltaproteobacteria bacterium]
MIGDITQLLLLPHINVRNANALSSPFTIGFPAMTAWLGSTHALQKKLVANGFSELNFKATAVISHHCDLQTYKGRGDFVHSIVGTGNPLDKNGERTAFIEEARCHLDCSLLVEYSGVDKDSESGFLDKISHLLNSQLKIAGGDILNFGLPLTLKLEEGNSTDLRKLTRKLMPGYAIIQRRELLKETMEDGVDIMDALLDYLAIHHSCEKDGEGNVIWTSKRKTAGWIVPIATGFHGISELGEAKNQRDPKTPHRFAESVVTLGEFIMPHRIRTLADIMWCYHVDTKKNLYLCQQSNCLTNLV